MRLFCISVITILSQSGMISTAHTQPFPTKPIRMIIGFTAGGEVDVIGRMIAHDGYTLFFNTVSHAATPALYPKATFDTLRDFAGVSQVTSLPNVLIIAPSAGIRNVRDLIALINRNPA